MIVLASFALILTVLARLCIAQDLTITLTPQGTPIQIPASGGSFDFNIAVSNASSWTVYAHVWCLITLPNGTSYGPVFGPIFLTMTAGYAQNRDRSQFVPIGEPPRSGSIGVAA
jgi:hypothetical protein